MAERDKKDTHANEDDQRHNREAEHPQREEPETLEGPGGRHPPKDDGNREEVTKRGER